MNQEEYRLQICEHCGMPEYKHLGPYQWCPRMQHRRRTLTRFCLREPNARELTS